MRSRLPATLAIVSAALMLGGCLERTISITTEPPGALVWLNDVELGRTPLETDFTFYGIYDVRIRREGFEPIITKAKASAPVQEWVGIDLLAEAAPVRFHDHVCWHWDLKPLPEAALGADQTAFETDLTARGRELRTHLTPDSQPAPVVRPEPTPEPAPAATPAPSRPTDPPEPK